MKAYLNIRNLTTFLMPLIVTCISYATPLDLCSEFTRNCAIQTQAVQGPEDPEDQYILDVTLGQISEAQFQTLQAHYRVQLNTPYDSQRIYKLVDFLPAFMQKMNGYVLVPHSLPAAPELLKALESQGKSTENVAYVDANCHSVTWQWVNHLQGKGSNEALLVLADGEQLGLDFKVKPRDLQPGDVLVIRGTGGFDQVDAVLHSAIYLGYGLVFEKGNPGAEYPYRMSYLKDVIGKYKKGVANASFNLYRIHAKSRILPTLVREYSLASPDNQSGLNLPAPLLEQYILQETWDRQQDMSVFTLGRILKDSEASPKNWYSILKNSR